MWAVTRTLRFRLAVAYFVVFASLLVGLLATALLLRRAELIAELDQRLIDRADLVLEVLELSARDEGDAASLADHLQSFSPKRLAHYACQLRDEEGSVLESSPNLGAAQLPFDRARMLNQRATQPVIETTASGAIEPLPGRLRILTVRAHAPVTDVRFVQVAVSMDEASASVQKLARLLVMIAGIGLLLGAGAAWLLARHALHPIRKIAAEARDLSAADLGRRLTLPPGQDELVEFTRTLNDMLDRLESAFHAQERFLANAAHELKTPVAIVLGEAQVLSQRDRAPEEYDRFVANVADEMRRFGQIVNSMLILARADAGLPLAAVETVSMNEVVMDAVTRCVTQASRREVRLKPVLVLPEPDQPDTAVQGDAELLRSAVVNLIRNAIRYSPVEEAVEIRVELEPPHVRISVTDCGPGVPDEIQNQLFGRFCSLPGRDDAGKSVGLGLSIAKGVSELHKGRIEFRNRPDRGAEFSIVLPLSTQGEFPTPD